MGKAARRRKTHHRRILVELSHTAPAEFRTAWEMRMESWLTEVHHLARCWNNGSAGDERIFAILDEAMAVLAECAPEIRRAFSRPTHDQICHECCAAVARVIDRRLYRLSNMAALGFKAGRSARVLKYGGGFSL